MQSLLVPPLLALTAGAPVQEPVDDGVWDLERLRAVAAGIQDQVEALRGLEFLRPVEIQLADHAQFLAHARRALEANGGRERMRRDEQVMKLLGLVPGDLDLLAMTTEVLAEQVGGFYDPATEAFYVMENVQPDLARVVIAHEFTHALDDQHHDLDGTARALEGNGDAAAAFHAVVEGSGMELMMQWAGRHMTAAQLARMAQAQSELPSEVISAAPPAIWKPLVAVYYQGQAFLRRQRKPSLLGEGARMGDIDRALRTPPRSTEQVIHPLKYWSPDHIDEPRLLVVDGVPKGATLSHQDTLGELQAALVTTSFEERRGLRVDMGSVLGLRFTNDAATGWGGDRYALVEQGDARVLVWETRWDTAEDADEFAAAIADLAGGIEAAKGRAEGHDPDRSGLEVMRHGGDGVTAVSWTGLPVAQALALATGVSIREGAQAGEGSAPVR